MARWLAAIVSVILIELFLFIAAFNWLALTGCLRRRSGRNVSMAPLIGGVLGAVGFALWPGAGLRPYAWIPLAADPGAALMCGGAAIGCLMNCIRKRKKAP